MCFPAGQWEDIPGVKKVEHATCMCWSKGKTVLLLHFFQSNKKWAVGQLAATWQLQVQEKGGGRGFLSLNRPPERNRGSDWLDGPGNIQHSSFTADILTLVFSLQGETSEPACIIQIS